MATAIQKFIMSTEHNGFFLTKGTLAELEKIDRLAQVLVRCGGCRFTCAAQDVAHLIKCVNAGGDYVRDVSFTAQATDAARAALQAERQAAAASAKFHAHKQGAVWTGRQIRFNEADCGGVFDGNQVTSDADPGL